MLESGRASRRHAKIVVSDVDAFIEDLNSANGVFVNGERLGPDPRRLGHDDFVVIGDLALEVVVEPRADSPIAPFVRPRSIHPQLPASHAATSKAHALELLASVADRALASAHPERAERALEEWLGTTLVAARSGRPSEPHLNALALKYALELAAVLRAVRWTDYAIELLSALGQPLDPERGALLDRAIRASGVSTPALEAYAAALGALPASTERDATLTRVARWRAQ